MAPGDKQKEIVEKVKQIISEQLGVEEAEVTPSASFTDDLGADSLDQVELVMALEENFDIEIPDDAAEHGAVLSRRDAADGNQHEHRDQPHRSARHRHRLWPS